MAGVYDLGLKVRGPPVGPSDSELLDFVLQSCSFYAEPSRCTIWTTEHSASLPKNLDDVVAVAVTVGWHRHRRWGTHSRRFDFR